MEEAQGLVIKFQKIMEDFCVPFGLALVDGFKEIDFHDEYAVRDFLDAITVKQKHLEDKMTLLNIAADLASKLVWLAKLDDPLEEVMPFHYLHLKPDTPFEEIEAHHKMITAQMRVKIEETDLGQIDLGLQRDLALYEKAFARAKEIRGVTE